MIFTDSQQQVSILDGGYNNILTKFSEQAITPELNHIFIEGIAPKTINDGPLTSVLSHGKITFTDTTTGYRMGLDNDKEYKFIIGGPSSSIDWNVTTANTLTV